VLPINRYAIRLSLEDMFLLVPQPCLRYDLRGLRLPWHGLRLMKEKGIGPVSPSAVAFHARASTPWCLCS
jgi:hypothetical protein